VQVHGGTLPNARRVLLNIAFKHARGAADALRHVRKLMLQRSVVARLLSARIIRNKFQTLCHRAPARVDPALHYLISATGSLSAWISRMQLV
jgi:hypothetical protein